MNDNDFFISFPRAKMKAQVAVLKDVVRDGYGGHTIDNVITQLEQRVKELEKIEKNQEFE